MCLLLVHLLALTLAKPFVEITNNYVSGLTDRYNRSHDSPSVLHTNQLAIFIDIQLFLTLFVSLLIQIGEGYQSVLFPSWCPIASCLPVLG